MDNKDNINNKDKAKNIKENNNEIQTIRFVPEIFCSYSNENISKNNNYFEFITKKNNTAQPKTGLVGLVFGISDKYIVPTNIFSQEYQKDLLEEFFEYFDSPLEIKYDTIGNINELICKDVEFPFVFLKTYISRHKEFYYKIENFNNLRHLSNIMCTILLNTRLEADKVANLSLTIIYIGQRIYYCYPNQAGRKVFLCALLNKILIFKCESFWEEIILFKLKLKLNILSQEIQDKCEKIHFIKTDNTKKTNAMKAMKKRDSMLSNMYDKRKSEDLSLDTNIAESKLNDSYDMTKDYISPYSNTKDEDKFNKKNAFVEIINFGDDYEDLPNNLKKEYMNKAFKILHRIILEQIPAFVNFNFGQNNAINYLAKICTKFSINHNLTNYYVIYLNSSSYNIKQYYALPNYNIKQKIDDIKIKNSGLNNEIEVVRNNSKILLYGFKSYKDEDKILILVKASKYLPNKEKLKLFFVNKIIYERVKHKIYKSILKELPITADNLNTRLGIWNTLLKTDTLRKLYPYQKELEKVKTIKYDHKSNCDFCIIDMDCQRTFFEENLKENREAINNILKTSTNISPNTFYCQGMNFMAGFLIRLTNNEEEVFYLMLGLFMYSKFKDAFLNDLEKLHLYFKTFERILSLYLPTLASYLKVSNVQPNFYLSGWFITLFTSSMNKCNYLDGLIKTFDNFIIDGWKSIFNTGLIILKENEEKILALQGEELLQYLTGVIVENNMFDKTNQDFIKSLTGKSLITRKLIYIINNEYEHIKRFEDKLQNE